MSAPSVKTGSLTLSPAPHVHRGETISTVMYTFVIALLPAVIWSISLYGVHAARVLAMAVACAMAFDWILQKAFRSPVTIGDGSAMLTGLLFALLLPPSVPWWIIVVGVGGTILIGRQLFGGLGGNPFSPALVGWAILRVSWPEYLDFNIAMVHYNVPFSIHYPLDVVRWAGTAGLDIFPTLDLLLGRQVGGMGATPVLLILLGGLLLIVRGVISWRIPLAFLVGVAATAWLFSMQDDTLFASPMFHLLTGNVMLGAFFLSTDPPSSPVGRLPMLLFGLGCGTLTVLFRSWSVHSDGVIFAILLMNILNPLLDKLRPRVPVAPLGGAE